jgi:hypothetical protein
MPGLRRRLELMLTELRLLTIKWLTVEKCGQPLRPRRLVEAPSNNGLLSIMRRIDRHRAVAAAFVSRPGD